LTISPEERQQALRLLAGKRLRPGHERRLRVIVLTAQGLDAAVIAAQVGISRHHISRVRARFVRSGLDGLADQPRAGRKSRVAPDLVARLIAAAGSSPPAGAPRWTLSLLAADFGLSRSIVYRILRRQTRAPA
jgi:transposase